jgi:hypothetical protein
MQQGHGVIERRFGRRRTGRLEVDGAQPFAGRVLVLLSEWGRRQRECQHRRE